MHKTQGLGRDWEDHGSRSAQKKCLLGDPISKNKHYTPVIPATWEAEIGGLWAKTNTGKSPRPYLIEKKKTKEKSIGGVAQVAEYLS
jgi:hypothetical protein